MFTNLASGNVGVKAISTLLVHEILVRTARDTEQEVSKTVSYDVDDSNCAEFEKLEIENGGEVVTCLRQKTPEDKKLEEIKKSDDGDPKSDATKQAFMTILLISSFFV